MIKNGVSRFFALNDCVFCCPQYISIMGNAGREKSNSAATFAGFVRDHLLEILEDRQSPQRPVGELEKRCIAGMNRFLRSQYEAPINDELLVSVPQDLHERLEQFFDNRNINREPNVMNSGDEARARSHSPKVNQQLAEFYQCLANYHRDRMREIEKPRPSTFGLFEMSFEPDPDYPGRVKTDLQPVPQLALDKKALIMLGGLDGVAHNTSYLASHAGMIWEMLGKPDADQPVRLYFLTYPDVNHLQFIADIYRSNADIYSYYKPEIRQWVEHALLPAAGIEADAPLPSPQELEQRLRMLRFATRSIGSIYAMQIRNAMADILREYGYDSAAIRYAFRNITAHLVHPVSLLRRDEPETGLFNTLAVASPHDLTIASRANMEHLIPEGEQAPTKVKVNDRTLLLWRDSPVVDRPGHTYIVRRDPVRLRPLETQFPTHDARLTLYDVLQLNEQKQRRYHRADIVPASFRKGVFTDELEGPESFLPETSDRHQSDRNKPDVSTKGRLLRERS